MIISNNYHRNIQYKLKTLIEIHFTNENTHETTHYNYATNIKKKDATLSNDNIELLPMKYTI